MTGQQWFAICSDFGVDASFLFQITVNSSTNSKQVSVYLKKKFGQGRKLLMLRLWH